MSIPRNHRSQSGSAGRIDRAGEYKVSIEKIEMGKSKSDKPMLTITFVTDDEKRIRGYYVRTLDFHMKALSDLKVACGLPANASIDLLSGKKLGIAVGEQTPTEDGKIFMQIEGYGKESDVSSGESPSANNSDFNQSTEEDLPF